MLVGVRDTLDAADDARVARAPRDIVAVRLTEAESRNAGAGVVLRAYCGGGCVPRREGK